MPESRSKGPERAESEPVWWWPLDLSSSSSGRAHHKGARGRVPHMGLKPSAEYSAAVLTDSRICPNTSTSINQTISSPHHLADIHSSPECPRCTFPVYPVTQPSVAIYLPNQAQRHFSILAPNQHFLRQSGTGMSSLASCTKQATKVIPSCPGVKFSVRYPFQPALSRRLLDPFCQWRSLRHSSRTYMHARAVTTGGYPSCRSRARF